jgi:hypothetical protein
VSELVVVARLRPGVRERVLELLRQGPPFAVEETAFDRRRVYLTEHEVVFVFEGPGPPTLELPGEDPAVWRAAEVWQECLAGPPRVARTAFAWTRAEEPDGVSFAPTPGPGDSDGGDVYVP